MKVILCQDGARRHDPKLISRLKALGAGVGFVECFDKCETCERCVLARIDGATVAAKSSDALLEMVITLMEED